MDIFTKYCWICPLRKPTAANIIKCLEKDIFLKYGTPATIICDNGQQFVSNIFKNFISSYGIETTFYNAVYSPQCNPVERANRTIETAIASYVTNNHKVWDANVPQIQAAINSTTSLAHSYTPHFLMHGMELILDGKARRNTDGNGPSNRTAHATRLTALAHVFQEVQDKLFEAFQTNQRHYNVRRKDGNFQVGDVVWRRNFVQSNAAEFFSSKLAPRFVKNKVVRRVSSQLYILSDMDGKVLGKYHVKDIVKEGATSD